MNPENLEYNIKCEICGTETSVVVFDVDERPAFCSMCGEEVEAELVI